MMEPYPFEAIYGAWWGRVVRQGGKEALLRSARRYLDWVGWTGSPL